MHFPATLTAHRTISHYAWGVRQSQALLRSCYYSTSNHPAGPSTCLDPIPVHASLPNSPNVPRGLIPAYDEAVAFLKADSERLSSRLKQLQTRLQHHPEDIELKNRIAKLEIESQINDVDVRARHKAGLGDMTNTVYRHLKEKDWREGGRLGRTVRLSAYYLN